MGHGYHYATIFIKQGANLQNSASKKRVTMANLHEIAFIEHKEGTPH